MFQPSRAQKSVSITCDLKPPTFTTQSVLAPLSQALRISIQILDGGVALNQQWSWG